MKSFFEWTSQFIAWFFGIAVSLFAACVFCVFAAGGFATTDGYAINRTYVGARAVPSNNVFFQVVEVRNLGTDRIMFTTFDIDEAIRVMKEFEGK